METFLLQQLYICRLLHTLQSYVRIFKCVYCGNGAWVLFLTVVWRGFLVRQKQEKKSMLCLSKVLLILCESCSETSSLASFVFLGLSLFADFLSASRSFLFTLCVFLSFTCTKLCSGEIHLYILTAGLRVQMELHNLTHAHTHTDTHTAIQFATVHCWETKSVLL